VNRNLPVQAAAAPRVIHYVQPAPQADASLLLYTAAELASRRREEQVLYARWLARRAVQAERDRRVRRFWLGFGAVVAVAVLAALALLGWLAYQAISGVMAGAGLGLLGVLAVVLLVALVGVGGHRCVTTIQHWH
jgi:hypothetical protein